MKAHITAFISGVVFALGLGISGMTRPVKVIGFLDFFGAWDASLAFVMIGAIAVYFMAYQWGVTMPAPLLVEKFALPMRRDLDPRLIIGAAIFGVGWGLGGFCPGPAITSVASGSPAVLTFVAAMVAGMYLHGWISSLSATAANWKVVAPSSTQDA